MTDLRQAAIELLKSTPDHVTEHWPELDEVVKALAQPDHAVDLLLQSAQEGWRYANECELEIKRLQELTEKREWVGLTNDEIMQWWKSENGLEYCVMSELFDFEMVVRAVEAKLKEKNNDRH